MTSADQLKLLQHKYVKLTEAAIIKINELLETLIKERDDFKKEAEDIKIETEELAKATEIDDAALSEARKNYYRAKKMLREGYHERKKPKKVPGPKAKARIPYLEGKIARDFLKIDGEEKKLLELIHQVEIDEKKHFACVDKEINSINSNIVLLERIKNIVAHARSELMRVTLNSAVLEDAASKVDLIQNEIRMREKTNVNKLAVIKDKKKIMDHVEKIGHRLTIEEKAVLKKVIVLKSEGFF